MYIAYSFLIKKLNQTIWKQPMLELVVDMLIFVFDTETDGLPKNMRNVPNVSNYQDWPAIVQLGYLLYDTDAKKVVLSRNHIIRVPHISEESTRIHGVTTAISQEEGFPLKWVLNAFLENMKLADIVVAHNMEFDQKVVVASLYSIMVDEPGDSFWVNAIGSMMYSNKLYCTMQESIELCKLEAFTKTEKKPYKKFPSLLELCRHLFNDEPKGLHNAMNDVIVCFRCFYKMRFGVDVCEENEEMKLWMNGLHT